MMVTSDEITGLSGRQHRRVPPAASPAGLSRWRPLVERLLVPLALVLLTVGLRLINLRSSYDLFIDEPFYVALGQSVAQGHLPYATGSLFFLHPPGHSVLEALWIHLVGGLSGSVLDQVFTMRYLNVVFSGITAVLLYLCGRRVSSSPVGAVATLLFAISPWFIRQNSFVLLETSALTFVLIGFLAVLHLPTATARRRLVLVLVGLSFGFGVLIKEMAVFVTVVPMVLLAWRQQWPLRAWRRPTPPKVIGRGEAVLVIGATSIPYLTWCFVVALNGAFAEFWSQTMSGFRRASGAHQISGFNQAGTPSFVSTILVNAPQFWTTYLLMALGAICSIHLLLQAAAGRRVVGAFGVGSLPLLGYSALFGANEEQFYYYLLIPSCLALAICLPGMVRVAIPWGRRALLVLAVIWAASDLTNWAIAHTTPDDGVQQVDTWMRTHVPAGTPVAVTDAVQREVFLRYQMIDDDSPTALQVPGGVEYLVVFQKSVMQGYAFIGPDALADQIGARKPVFTTSGRGNWNSEIYDLR